MGQTKTKTPSTEGCGVAYVSTIDWLHDGTGSSEPRQTRVLTTSPSAREKLDSRTKARTRPKDSGLAPSEYAHVGHGLCNTPLARRLCSQGQYGAVTLVQCLLLDKTQRRSDRIIKISPPPPPPSPLLPPPSRQHDSGHTSRRRCPNGNLHVSSPDVTCPDKATFSKVGNDQAKNGNSGKGKDQNKTNQEKNKYIRLTKVKQKSVFKWSEMFLALKSISVLGTAMSRGSI